MPVLLIITLKDFSSKERTSLSMHAKVMRVGGAGRPRNASHQKYGTCYCVNAMLIVSLQCPNSTVEAKKVETRPQEQSGPKPRVPTLTSEAKARTWCEALSGNVGTWHLGGGATLLLKKSLSSTEYIALWFLQACNRVSCRPLGNRRTATFKLVFGLFQLSA